MWTGFLIVAVWPSPKVQDHDVGSPVDSSVNWTARGVSPVVVLAVNAAVGDSPIVISSVYTVWIPFTSSGMVRVTV